jgi:hypothetical protein
MRVWWDFRCDWGHRWEAYIEDAPEPPAELAICPIDGSEAITAAREPPADRVSVTLVPGARIVDPTRGQVSRESRYYLEVWSWDGSQVLRSAQDFDWDGAVERASWFNNRTWDEAVNRWERTGLTIEDGSIRRIDEKR